MLQIFATWKKKKILIYLEIEENSRYRISLAVFFYRLKVKQAHNNMHFNKENKTENN